MWQAVPPAQPASPLMFKDMSPGVTAPRSEPLFCSVTCAFLPQGLRPLLSYCLCHGVVWHCPDHMVARCEIHFFTLDSLLSLLLTHLFFLYCSLNHIFFKLLKATPPPSVRQCFTKENFSLLRNCFMQKGQIYFS